MRGANLFPNKKWPFALSYLKPKPFYTLIDKCLTLRFKKLFGKESMEFYKYDAHLP